MRSADHAPGKPGIDTFGRRSAVVVATVAAVLVSMLGAAGPAAVGSSNGCSVPEPPTYFSQSGAGEEVRIAELDGASSVPFPDAGVGIEISYTDAPDGAPVADGYYPVQTVNLSVLWQDRTQVLTTAPYHPGGYYPSRGGSSSAITDAGPVTIATVGDRTYLVLNRSTSGLYTQLAWRIDDPCASEAVAADAVPGTADYTG